MAMKTSSTSFLKKYGWPFLLIVLIVAAAVYFLINTAQPQRVVTPDLAFAAYISGYTGGVISKNHTILIKLAKAPLKNVDTGVALSKSLLTFSPAIAGKTSWKDHTTLVFTPSEPLKSGAIYTATLQLDKLVPVSDKKFDRFVFGFQVIPQSFEMQPIGLKASGTMGLEQFDYEGKLLTADQADDEAVEKVVTAHYAGKEVALQWEHLNSTTHIFTIPGLKRGKQPRALKLTWSGEPIGVRLSGGETIAVPAEHDFRLLNARVGEGATPAVHFFFSDPLDDEQSFNGLVKIDTLVKMTYSIDGNELTVYPGRPLSGSQEVHVYQGIKNVNQQALVKDSTLHLVFEDLKPAVRFIGQGNILPSTNGLILPIEAVNLKTIQLRVIKIYPDRIGQFLQVNDLDGSEGLTRVGRPILQKVIHLDNMGVQDLGKWNRFTLELSKLISPDPGAIYQIAICFTKQDVALGCAVKEDGEGLKHPDDPREQTDEAPFDDGDSRYFYDDFGQYYGSDYKWSERNNPCNSAYYSGGNNVIKRNILATDIGLIAKRGTDNSLMIVATNLKTAAPRSGVTLRIFNPQLQQIGTTSTGADGMATLNTPDKAFLVEAEDDHQWAYLKLMDGTALSVSQFDVSGSRVQQGIKGFLYGERGVWRPGDSIYLSFMLEDKIRRLPDHHPVVFTLTNPRGMTVQRRVSTASVEGLYSFATATAADAPTGNWTAEVKVGGATFSKIIKVETIKPNRLKIALRFPGDRLTPDQNTGKLHVRWLSGATAGNLHASYEMILSKAPTTFKGYTGYQFDDPVNDFKTVDRTVFDGQLDARGDAIIHPSISLEAGAPSSLKAYFKGKVYEPGGNFSINYQSVPYYPYSKYIGIKVPGSNDYGNMLDLDKNYDIQVATVNTGGRPIDMDSLEVKVYKTRWRWWWEQNENAGANFVNNKYYQQVMTQKVSTKNGKGSFSLRIHSPEWGRYYIRVTDSSSGYTAGAFVYFEWPANAGSTLAGMPGGATRLSFTSDKQVYQVGEKIKLYIPGSGDGRAFITVEDGSHVIGTYWMKEKKGSNEFTIPVTAEMSPNVYIDVAEIQPHGQTVNDLPIRQYGIIGVKVEDPATVLQPEISMPEELRPNKKVSLNIREKSGKPMAYTIAIVDEGLLDLTGYKTPAPWNVFYAKEALGVKTWDVFDHVIGAYGARIERLLSIGGDGAVTEKPQAQNIRFKPVVKFLGPYFLEKGKTATHSFVMPNYIGEVRAMVVAGYQGAYGSVDKSVKVTQPLMILSTLPRVAGPGEQISLPVNIFAMKKGVQDITVKVSTDPHFSITGGTTRRIHLDQPGDSLVEFTLQVNDLTGNGKIHVVASGGGYTATNDIELAVRNPNPPETHVLSKSLQPGESWAPDIKLFGIKGTNSLQLEVAAIPPLNLGKRLNFLLEYPYGCLEQTVSAAFPQLYMDKLVPLSEAQKKAISTHTRAAIQALNGFQQAGGGFTYWPGSNYADDWVTSYAGDFLLEARKKGYHVMNDVLDKWAAYQTGRAGDWNPQKKHPDDLVQAYRLYTLALAQRPLWSAMNRMRGLQQLSLQARWRLADAYMIAGKQQVAEQLVTSAGTAIPSYRSMGYSYGSATRDKAMILQTLTDMGDQDKGFVLARDLSHTLNSDEWLNTQETAYSLIALAGFYAHRKAASEVHYSYRIDHRAPVAQKTTLPESRVDLPVKDQAPGLEISNTAKGTLYAQVVIRGTSATGQETATQHDLQMQVRYQTTDGKALDPGTLKQGTGFVAEITVRNPGLRGDYQHLALS
ncbi:MAG TPA: MG2 domain-containing protein, partial [Chitinophagaceae bacterium]|nr:MG2 domain-containing protein [Chitinophagaceae bacterium]